jgi:hypothetical protein
MRAATPHPEIEDMFPKKENIEMRIRPVNSVKVTAPAFLAMLIMLFSSSSAMAQGQPWGPETPNFNLEVVLRGEGFGLVKFRQPNDDSFIVNLDVWVRNLAPNTSYLLQRAVDEVVDDDCTSTNWLTLGKGNQAQSIITDDTGSGRQQLFRNLAAFPAGSEFDIHFRVIEEETSEVVLTSQCYQFTISQ